MLKIALKNTKEKLNTLNEPRQPIIAAEDLDGTSTTLAPRAKDTWQLSSDELDIFTPVE